MLRGNIHTRIFTLNINMTLRMREIAFIEKFIFFFLERIVPTTLHSESCTNFVNYGYDVDSFSAYFFGTAESFIRAS